MKQISPAENPSQGGRYPSVFSNVYKKAEKELFLGGLRYNTTIDEIWDAFSKFGTVASVRLKRYKDGSCKGFGFLKFKRTSSAMRVINIRFVDLSNCRVECFEALPKHQAKVALSECISRKIHFEHNDNDVTEQDLYLYFSTFGRIQKLYFSESVSQDIYKGAITFTFQQPVKEILRERHQIKSSPIIVRPATSKYEKFQKFQFKYCDKDGISSTEPFLKEALNLNERFENSPKQTSSKSSYIQSYEKWSPKSTNISFYEVQSIASGNYVFHVRQSPLVKFSTMKPSGNPLPSYFKQTSINQRNAFSTPQSSIRKNLRQSCGKALVAGEKWHNHDTLAKLSNSQGNSSIYRTCFQENF